MAKKRIKVIGAGGYGGVGIVELLLQHPEVEIACLVAKDNAGAKMSDLYPHLRGYCDMQILAVDDPAAAEPVDLVFFSTPDGVAMRQAGVELERGAKVIDYSGDFRFNSVDTYAEYARRIGRDPIHAAPELLPQSSYGLSELGLADIAQHQIVGNPGCFAMSCLLGLAPAAKEKLFVPGSLICDCKTGVSGAGKKPNAAFHYPARYDHMNAYRLSGHQHVCEVETNLSTLAGEDIQITFTAQVVPTTRGILSTLYAELAEGQTRQSVMAAYQAFYKDQYFVRLYGHEEAIGTAHVRGSNHAALIVDVDERNNKLRIVSHIDNLVKGQAGNALQNMNLMLGFEENTGLQNPGQYP